MRQRDSIDLPVLSVAPQNRRVVSQTISLSLVRFFLEGNNTDVDILFLDVKDVHRAIREGRQYASKLSPIDDVYEKLKAQETLQSNVIKGDSIASVLDTFSSATKNTVAALVLTFANGNVLTVAGSSSNYYIFDVLNQIFASVQHPLYDVMDYHQELGEAGAFLATSWSLKSFVAVESESEAPPTPVKKQKVSEEEEVTIPAAPEEEEEPKKKKSRTIRKKAKTEEVE